MGIALIFNKLKTLFEVLILKAFTTQNKMIDFSLIQKNYQI